MNLNGELLGQEVLFQGSLSLWTVDDSHHHHEEYKWANNHSHLSQISQGMGVQVRMGVKILRLDVLESWQELWNYFEEKMELTVVGWLDCINEVLGVPEKCLTEGEMRNGGIRMTNP